MNGSNLETNVNRELARLLRKTGLQVHKESSGNPIDVKVVFDTHTVAIECKNHSQYKRGDAVKSALSRLGTNSIADVSIALVYPKGCTDENITMETKMDFAVVGNDLALSIEGSKTSNSKIASQLEWHNRDVWGLADVVRGLSHDVGNPDVLAAKLRKILKEQTRRLSNEYCVNLARRIELEPKPGDVRPAAERALLVVASAAMFHARLSDNLASMRPDIDDRTCEKFAGDWPPDTLRDCMDKANIITALLDSWDLILAIDYKPIFITGREVLKSNASPMFADVIKKIITWASESAGNVAGLRHDLLGRLFHKVLHDAKFDGSYYTSMPAATLLSSLAIRDESDIHDGMRIMDPACGTGTLLMAAAERAQSVGKIDETKLIEDVLVGVDINVTALHMASTTLGLLSPTTKFKKLRIYRAKFGSVQEDTTKRQRGQKKKGRLQYVAAGSLEMYKDGTIEALLNWSSGVASMRQIDSDIKQDDFKHSADLLIMNPPFTRHDIRHDQLGAKIKGKVIEREHEIFLNAPAKPSKTSSGPMFIILAEYLTKPTGTIALILPASAAMNPSTANLRVFLAKRFHIETIISSHDPERIWFSESTKISEMLIIMRRGPKKHTKIVNLAINPGTTTAASALASDIKNDIHRTDMTILKHSRSAIESGDWSGAQFFSPYLAGQFRKLKTGKLFNIKKLKDVADIGPNGRTISMYFTVSDQPTSDDEEECYPSLYGHKTGVITSIQAKPEQYITPKRNKTNAVASVLKKQSTLLVPERLRLNLTHVSAVKSTVKTIGSAWTPVRPFKETAKDPEMWSKAMAIYFNSTLGIISMLGVRIPFELSYPKYSLDKNQREIPVPVLTESQIDMLVKTFDKYATKEIGRWSCSDDPVRTGIDGEVCGVLDASIDDVNKMRHELAREPMCTGKRYGE